MTHARNVLAQLRMAEEDLDEDEHPDLKASVRERCEQLEAELEEGEGDV